VETAVGGASEQQVVEAVAPSPEPVADIIDVLPIIKEVVSSSITAVSSTITRILTAVPPELTNEVRSVRTAIEETNVNLMNLCKAVQLNTEQILILSKRFDTYTDRHESIEKKLAKAQDMLRDVKATVSNNSQVATNTRITVEGLHEDLKQGGQVAAAVRTVLNASPVKRIPLRISSYDLQQFTLLNQQVQEKANERPVRIKTLEERAREKKGKRKSENTTSAKKQKRNDEQEKENVRKEEIVLSDGE
jgi:uncharacterized protein YqgV (UPF0045/DUF77 family)